MSDTEAKKQLVYIGERGQATLSVVDLATSSIVHTIPMGSVELKGVEIGIQVDYMVATADYSTLYITRFPYSSKLKSIPGVNPVSGDVIALDTATNEILWTLPIDGKPNHLSLSLDERHIYVPIRDRQHLDVIDVKTQKVVDQINCGIGPHCTARSADGRRLYVGASYGHTLDTIDLESNRMIQQVHMGEAVRPFIVTADHSTAYVQVSRLHGFLVVDMQRARISHKVYLPELPLGTAYEKTFAYTVNHGLAINHDETELWVAGTAGGYAAIYEIPSLRLLDTVDLGREPAYLQLSADKSLLFATDRKGDTLSIVDVAQRRELSRIPVGKQPDRVRYVELAS